MKTFLFLLAFSPSLWAQISFEQVFEQDNDLNIGGDIFNDFSEDLDSTNIMEDERYFRYGRFFSFQIGVGATYFDGNRGLIYKNYPPSYTLSLNYFLDFQSSFGLGLGFSKHSMYFRDITQDSANNPFGFIDVSMFRFFFSYRYYIDTSNLGTAITWSSPYFNVRMEYWYTTNKYLDRLEILDETGGGFGTALGFGFEFPLKLKESYVNLEFLFHAINFADQFTSKYQPLQGGFGVQDLSGRGYTTMLSYVFNW